LIEGELFAGNIISRLLIAAGFFVGEFPFLLSKTAEGCAAAA
jgi:hypothetical protein